MAGDAGLDEIERAGRELRFREDQDSVQVSALGSRRFWLRLLLKAGDIIFSDFLLDPDDTFRAVAALRHLQQAKGILEPGARVVLQDIMPDGGSVAPEKRELVRRHDQIVGVFTEFSALTGLGIPVTHLDTHAGRFTTIVFLSSRP